MPFARRFWLFLPFVVLTVFFAACGWRNWHLSDSEDEVWLDLPAYYLAPPAPTKLPNGMMITGFEPPPFVVGQTTILSRRNTGSSKSEPLPASLLRQMQQRYPQLRLRNWPPSTLPSGLSHERHVFIASVHFQSKFAATCSVIFGSTAPHMAQSGLAHMVEAGTYTGTLTLTRSPSPLRDTHWHVTAWHMDSLSIN